jgi:CRISPR/Cas system CSM-associated protein Csm4 (group 5 of RAMP superfamily)
MLKTKKEFIQDQLNIDLLTPIQWDGIMRAMHAYAEHYHEEQVKQLNNEMRKYRITEEIFADKRSEYIPQYTDNDGKDWNYFYLEESLLKWKILRFKEYENASKLINADKSISKTCIEIKYHNVE